MTKTETVGPMKSKIFIWSFTKKKKKFADSVLEGSQSHLHQSHLVMEEGALLCRFPGFSQSYPNLYLECELRTLHVTGTFN